MTTFTLAELEKIIAEIKSILEKQSDDAMIYNLCVRDLNYYTRLANKIQAGA